jgi:Secretion system C-terminal sorting domain
VGITKGSSSTITYITTPLSLNQDHLIIIKYSIQSGATDDVLNIYTDPVYASGVPVSASAQTIIGTDAAANIDRLTLRQNTGSGIPTGKIGLLSVAKTWSDLAFTTLSSNQFDKSTFAIISNDLKNGNLLVKSNITLDNASLNIFDIQGRNIERKDITLNENLNTFSVNTIKNSGVYIVEITAQNAKFIQKIIVQ